MKKIILLFLLINIFTAKVCLSMNKSEDLTDGVKIEFKNRDEYLNFFYAASAYIRDTFDILSSTSGDDDSNLFIEFTFNKPVPKILVVNIGKKYKEYIETITGKGKS